MASDFDYYEHDNAKFRRPRGNIGGVHDVLHGNKWVRYKGDTLKPAMMGERIEDPLGADTQRPKAPDVQGNIRPDHIPY